MVTSRSELSLILEATVYFAPDRRYGACVLSATEFL
jgi:hypothetical protein